MNGNGTRRGRPWLRFLGLAGLVMLALGGAWAFRIVQAIGGGTMNAKDVIFGINRPLEQFPANPHPIILIVGKDYTIYRQKAHTRTSRADTIMLVSADLTNKKLSAISIPRDTKVKAPDGVVGKINATYLRGGIELLEQTIVQEFGIRPDYHVVLKADAVKNMVDAVGGVEVEPIDRMFYEAFWGDLYIDLLPGRQRINGKQAVGFVRFRKTGDHRVGPKGESIPVDMPPSKEEGDIRRTERQQQLIRALMAEAFKPHNLTQAGRLIDVAFDQVDTNLSRTQVLALATVFRDSSGGLSGSVLPGTDSMSGDLYFYEVDHERARLMCQWLLRGDEAAGRKLTRVEVHNASNVAGVGRRAAEQLSALGYSAFAVNGRETVSEVVYRKAAYEETAREIAQTLGIDQIRKDPSNPNATWLPEIKVILTTTPLGLAPESSEAPPG